MTETPGDGEHVLDQVAQLGDDATAELVTPLLEKTTFPDDDGEDAPAEPGDGTYADAPLTDLPAVDQ